ncbi:Glu/Leu/Phe/Val dehydrogenase family protein [Caulobacter soli]|uniref:Glu/Leu/Phe/Val dehydrogenase family protein n=1 Tax=Caulobacter soli TaxID=2708539 RepID=UPI0013EDCD86|nr:Glu/Leu/Phe/Val dehydrogenase family protein [Caulobacter soli]
MLEQIPSQTHEAVYRADRPDLGVTFFIALHSTRLGPAFGGARMWRYQTEADALSDALRLSEGMTYKNAMAELDVGGGKSVLWLREPGKASRAAIFTAFGDILEELGGRYISAEDVGTSVADMQVVRTRTRHIAGLPPAEGRAGGDPSPWTALGVFCAMQAVLDDAGRPWRGVKVAVQGLGAVGGRLCGLLAEAGADLIVSDVSGDRAMEVAERYSAVMVDPSLILRAPVDILAPCALGGILNPQTIPDLNAQYVVGAANNQLATPEDGDQLAQRGVLYVPDYVANAGGIICAVEEFRGRNADRVDEKVRVIGPRVGDILRLADQQGRAPFRVAQAMVDDILAAPVLARVEA